MQGNTNLESSSTAHRTSTQGASITILICLFVSIGDVLLVDGLFVLLRLALDMLHSMREHARVARSVLSSRLSDLILVDWT